jgi:competence protein ComEA
MYQFFENLFSRIKELPKKYVFPLLICFLGIVLILYGLIQFLGNNQPQGEISNLENITITPIVKTVKKIQIDVEGGVVNKGVYLLDQDSRIKDALIAAGGLSVDADRIFVEKQINLASKITDGQKIYIPRKGESILNNGAEVVAGSSQDQQLQININTSSAQELDGLPGIGLITAQKIMDGRPYQDKQELLSKKIVGQKVYDQIKDRITSF